MMGEVEVEVGEERMHGIPAYDAASPLQNY